MTDEKKKLLVAPSLAPYRDRKFLPTRRGGFR